MHKYNVKVPFDRKYVNICVSAIENAEYLYQNYMLEEEFPTDNGSEGAKWNYINKLVKIGLSEDRFQIEVLYRGPWKFLGIYDRKTKYFYTLMREKNLNMLRRNATCKLFHYTNALSKLNDKLKDDYAVENEQLCLFPDMMYDEEGEALLEKILSTLVRKLDGSVECYVLIAFDISHGQVTSIKGVVPSVGMNYFKEEDWTDLLSATYSDDDKGGEEAASDDIILLERRPRLERRKKIDEKQEEK